MAALFRREDADKHGHATCIDHGGPKSLRDSQGKEDVDGWSDGERNGGQSEASNANTEDPTATDNVTDAAHHKHENIDGNNIRCAHKAKLHSTSAKICADGWQAHVYGGDHEWHEVQGRTCGKEHINGLGFVDAFRFCGSVVASAIHGLVASTIHGLVTSTVTSTIDSLVGCILVAMGVVLRRSKLGHICSNGSPYKKGLPLHSKRMLACKRIALPSYDGKT